MCPLIRRLVCFGMACLLTLVVLGSGPIAADEPVSLIFDTDMGNDIDDALALGVIHALESRGECRLLAVTVSKSNPDAARYCDLVNTFYGRGDIPIGLVRNGKTPQAGKFVRAVAEAEANGQPLYPHDLTNALEATAVLRRVLAEQPDQSVVLVVVGFSTNMARLLESQPDEYSPLTGRGLVARKVRLLSMMAGRFGQERPKDFQEYNVREDFPAAGKVFDDWPTPIVISGFEIGLSILYPAASIERDFDYVRHHPLKHGYELYGKMPYDRPTWDLTSVLFAVRPDRGYFGLAAPGELSIGEKKFAVHTPGGHGRHRYLTVTPEQIIRVREALVFLASQPPQTQ